MLIITLGKVLCTTKPASESRFLNVQVKTQRLEVVLDRSLFIAAVFTQETFFQGEGEFGVLRSAMAVILTSTSPKSTVHNFLYQCREFVETSI